MPDHDENKYIHPACLAQRSHRAAQNKAFFSAPRFSGPRRHATEPFLFPDGSAIHVCFHSLRSYAQASYVVVQSENRACLCADLLTGCRGFWNYNNQVHCRLTPTPGSPAATTVRDACPYMDRTGTNSNAARPQGKRCWEMQIHDRNKYPHLACLTQRSHRAAQKKRIVFFAVPVALLRWRSPGYKKKAG
jgi:hypothetical protein